LPVSSPASFPSDDTPKFTLVINLNTAKALDVKVPVSLLDRADEVEPALLRCMSLKVAQLYGPAVRCKLNLQSGGDWSCASVSGPYAEQIAPGHHGYPRASDLILG
jgi:hypothetical protein